MVRKRSRWRKIMAVLLVCGMIVPIPAMQGGAAAAEMTAGDEALVKNTTETTTDVNLSLTAAATADGQEAADFAAGKAKDGDSNTRWASPVANGPHWLQLAWESAQTIKTVNIHWERTNATSYKLQKSENGTDWEDVKSFTAAPSSHRQKIILETPVSTKYLRLYIETFNPTGTKENGTQVTWNTVSVMEMETYATIPEQSLQEIADSLEVPARIESGTAQMSMPAVPEGYTISFIGADYEQIIDRDLTVYQPLVDKTVKMNFRITKTADSTSVDSKEYSTVVAGRNTQETGDNAKPAVLPELAEWKGGSGDFTVTDSSRIVVASKDEAALSYVAEEFKRDYEELTGRQISIAYADQAAAGDFFFTLCGETEKNLGLKDEGYYMTVGDKVEVKAEKNAGIYWSTRTILQILKQNHTVIPQGTARDYPKYEVRGFMLDIGRRPFSKKIVDEVIKTMAWYKMNDFQLHLNDNYIFLENYPDSAGAMSAYEGFRLESSIREGGAEGLYKADLTSDDMYYTKAEMRSMIQDYRKLGINIVPEIDTPAHSLSLTKTRPDLRMGTNGRENDHLNLNDKYDESLQYVKTIWDEYFEGDEPVFDRDTIINIGTDEYSERYTEQFRRFTDDMLAYGQSKVDRVRLWGSLTMRSGTTPVRSENVEMMMWNRGWANTQAMYQQGYKMVDINDGSVYIVPAAGYYFDYLNKSSMYSYDPARNMGLPSGSEQVLGGSYAIWNDMVDKKANGLTEIEIYDRFQDAAGMIACGLWGGNSSGYNTALELREELGTAPRTNAYDVVESTGDTVVSYEFEGDYSDSSPNSYDAQNGENTAVENGRLSLNGEASWAETPIQRIGSWGDGKQLTFEIELTAEPQPGDILFEADAEYGTYDIRIMEDGSLGFTREGYDYTFGYHIPLNERVTLTIEALQDSTSLYSSKTGRRAYTAVGSYTYEGDLKASGITRSAMSLPLERIGSKTSAVTAKLDNITVGAIEEWDRDGKAIPSAGFSVTCDNQQNGEGIKRAFDNNPETIWHSKYSPSKQNLPAEIVIDMGQEYAVDGIYYQTRATGSNGNITKFSLYYEDESGQWRAVAEDALWSSGTGEKTLFFDAVVASRMKLIVKEGDSGFGSAAEIKLLEAPHAVFAAAAEGNGTASVSRALALHGTQVTFLAEAEEGYEFRGWYNAEGQLVSREAEYSVTAESSLSLTAKFAAMGSGDVMLNVTIDGVSSAVAYGSTLTRPAEPSREGYRFLGWELEETGEIFDFTTPVTKDMVLTARFEKIDQGDKDTVAAPVFGVAAGTYTKAQSVTITSDTEGAVIYYTTDGTTPTADSTRYTKAITVNKSMTVKAIAVKEGMNNSAVASAAYVIREETEKPFPFEDVERIPSHWKYENIRYVYNNNIMNGISGTSLFAPDAKLNRAMFATVLYRMAGSPEVTFTDKFKDVKDEQYYSKAIIWANSKGIVDGYTNGNYGIEDNITREQIAKMLNLYAKVQGYDISDKKDLGSFTDADKVNGWATDFMKWATAVEMITGKPNDDGKTYRLDPKGQATRAECAKMLTMFLKKYE